MASRGGTLVEPLTHNPKLNGSIPAIVAGKVKIEEVLEVGLSKAVASMAPRHSA
jgi:hypothetical protein